MRLLLAIVLATGCAPAPDAAPVGVYAEFLDDGAVEAELPSLHGRASIAIAIADARIGDASLARLLRAADREGVDVDLWLVLDRSQGYWPNEDNLDLYDAALVRLLAWLESEQLDAASVVLDLEPAYDYSEELRAALDASDLTSATALMRAHLDPARYAASREALTRIVGRIHDAGLRARCVTYPQVVDDMGDDDDDLQDALDVPVRGVPFDEVAFMVYQTAFAAASSGGWIGPGLIASYARDARAALGDRAVIALGTIGTAGIFTPTGPVYEDPEVLRADVAAALAEDIARIELYSLDGMLGLGGAPRWLDATEADAERASVTSGARLVRSLAAVLDDQLDAP